MLNRNEIKSLVSGKFMTITFIKQDGTLRKINGRLGVKIGVKGKGKIMPTSILTIWEVKNRQFRNINVNTIKAINFNKNKLVTS